MAMEANENDSGGYDFDLVNSSDVTGGELKCTICTLLLKDPIELSNCSHSFCKGCWLKLQKFKE